MLNSVHTETPPDPRQIELPLPPPARDYMFERDGDLRWVMLVVCAAGAIFTINLGAVGYQVWSYFFGG